MQIEIQKNERAKLRLKVKETSFAFMNALRRAVISELEAFAAEEVDIYENNSPMFNEYIANRLGLIPLTYEENYGEGIDITLSLNAEGPCMVYSRDLKSSDERIKVFNDNIPIIKLGANQKLRLEAKVGRGTAKKHAKFQSGIASYSYDPEKRNPEFEFFVESYNNLAAEEQLMRALRLLEGRTDALLKSKELKQ